jgi:hypothetical protein
MKVKTIQGISVDEIKTKLALVCGNNYHPTLAIVFSSVKQDLKELSILFNKCDITVFGSSSSGEIEQDEIFEQSIVVMLMDIKKENFDIYIEETNNSTIKEISEQAVIHAFEKFENPGIIVAASGLDTDGEEIVEAMKNTTNKTFPIFGGLAGDDLQMEATYVFSNNKILNKGLVCLIINNDKIQISGAATSGWETIGVETTITKSKGNIVYSIDNEPALDFFIKYYNLEVDMKNKSDVIQKIGVKYPLQIIRESGKRVLRAALYANPEDNSIIFAGRVPEDAKATFSVPPTFEVIDKTINDIKKLQQNNKNTDAIIMFSCAARKIALGPLMEDEIAGIRNIWEAPLIGFFSYGEIGSSHDSTPDFHNETCCVVLLKEK